jgi:repressor LexA
LGLSSVATVHKHVSHLVQKGYVRRTWNQNRSIELVESRDRLGAAQVPLTGTIPPGAAPLAPRGAETVSVPAEMLRDPTFGFALRVVGDSMGEEGLRDGDCLLLERRDAADGDTVLVLVDGREPFLGRYRRKDTRVVLEPHDPRSSPLLTDLEKAQIKGVVVGLIRKY